MRIFNFRGSRSFVLTLLTTLGAGGTLSAGPAGAIKVPTNFQQGYLVNSLLITKEPNSIGLITGNHLIYVNRIGIGRLKHGGPIPYPAGTLFADDVRDFSVDEGIYHQGARKFVTSMIKDSKKYASTGGWGFQAWVDGDPSKPVVTDPVKQCFACHTPNKPNDYVFSTFLH